MLDINPENNQPVDGEQLGTLINIVITTALKTPYESRIFNPALGTNAVGLLQEPSHNLVSLMTMESLMLSAIKRALPGIVISMSLDTKSSGRGTADVRIKMNINYQGIYLKKEYSTLKKGFVN